MNLIFHWKYSVSLSLFYTLLGVWVTPVLVFLKTHQTSTCKISILNLNMPHFKNINVLQSLCILTIHNSLFSSGDFYFILIRFWFSTWLFYYLSHSYLTIHQYQLLIITQKQILFCLECPFPPSPTELSLVNFRTAVSSLPLQRREFLSSFM